MTLEHTEGKSGRRVLVTGSGRGIGRSIALRLVENDFAVTVHCRSRIDDGRAVCAEISRQGGSADLAVFDVTDRDAARRVLEEEVERRGAYYGIVCNVGVARDNIFAALSDEDWDIVTRTSLDGFYNVVHPLIMPMIRARQGGRIVTVSSVSGLVGNRGQVNYSAAKAGIIGATKALAIEVASRGITVNCVAPGLIETEMTKEVPREEALKLIPMKRMGQPEEVAGVVAFLLSAEAAYITRQVIGINGGMI